MEKNQILDYLENNNVENKDVLKSFIKDHSEIYARENLYGHITGSAFIINEQGDEGLLILHKKYNKWVAPGGHVDPHENAKIASKRESGEEVGLNDLELMSEEIFDIDIHRIPEAIKNGKVEPEHWHFDVRYLYKAPENCVVDVNLFETKGFKWEKLSNLANETDISIQRQANKAINFVKNNLKQQRKCKL